MEFLTSAIPHEDITARPSDEPLYDIEIRKYSTKRDRLKLTSHQQRGHMETGPRF